MADVSSEYSSCVFYFFINLKGEEKPHMQRVSTLFSKTTEENDSPSYLSIFIGIAAWQWHHRQHGSLSCSWRPDFSIKVTHLILAASKSKSSNPVLKYRSHLHNHETLIMGSDPIITIIGSDAFTFKWLFVQLLTSANIVTRSPSFVCDFLFFLHLQRIK